MFVNLWNWIKSLMGKGAAILERPAQIAVDVVNTIKSWVTNPIMDILAALTKTDVDDKILAVIRTHLPEPLAALLQAKNIISDIRGGDFRSLMDVLRTFLLGLTKSARATWWQDLAALIMQVLAANVHKKQVDFNYAKQITQQVYHKTAQ